jgi:glycosyltransferase involved in cell wall biosynthesis
VLTIHDVIHLEVPEEGSRLRSWYFQRVVRPAMLHAGMALTVSEFSRRRVTEVLGLPDGLVRNVGNGCSEAFFVPSETPVEAPPYVLFVGNARPHKRLDLVVAAARLLPRDVRIKCVGIQQEDLHQFSLDGEEHSRFELHTGLSDAELRDLYSGACVLAMPSSYEGFGLPAVEAMATGTPVVYCCDAVAEVVGAFGTRVSPDAGALADALVQFVESLPEDIDGMRAHARRFTWDSVAERIESALSERWGSSIERLQRESP